MTNDEVKALKPGDKVRIYWIVDYQGRTLGGTNEITVDKILSRQKSSTFKAAGHLWAVVTAKETQGKQWTIESDEYLQAFGYQTHVPAMQGLFGSTPMLPPTRKLGCEKIS